MFLATNLHESARIIFRQVETDFAYSFVATGETDGIYITRAVLIIL